MKTKHVFEISLTNKAKELAVSTILSGDSLLPDCLATVSLICVCVRAHVLMMFKQHERSLK